MEHVCLTEHLTETCVPGSMSSGRDDITGLSGDAFLIKTQRLYFSFGM